MSESPMYLFSVHFRPCASVIFFPSARDYLEIHVHTARLTYSALL